MQINTYNWSLIENKQRFIGQIFTSKSPVRSADDIDATALSYAEVKALATGDTRIKEKMDLDIQVAKLKLMRSSHNSQRYEMEDRVIKYYPAEIKKTTERIEGLKADTQIVKSHPVGEENFSMTVQGQQFTDRKLAGEAIIEACKQMKNPDEKIALGEYRGFPMTLSMDSGKFHVSMKQAVTHIAELENNVTGNIARINNALEAMPKNIETLTDRLERLGDEMTSAKLESERPFPKEGEYQEKSKRLTELNILLDNADKEEPSGEKDVSHEKSDTVHVKEKPSVLQALKTLKATETDRDKSVPGKLLEAR